MNPALELWLKRATRKLSTVSAAQVRTEILEHYAEAREAASTTDDADGAALAALGDAATANRQYREVLLTASEAKLLSQDNREARTFCAYRWLKWLILPVPSGLFLVAILSFITGKPDTARGLLGGAIGVAIWATSPFLPIYTPMRGLVWRILKWAVLLTALGMVFQYSWLFICCLGPLVSNEWTRASIRRKMPVAQWPKQLYL